MITLAIPSYNRSNYVIESFSSVISDERISEILIVDDCSELSIYSDLNNLIDSLKDSEFFTKIRIIRNEKNLGSFYNKFKCVEESKNDWIILLDSDNSIDVDYINSLDEKRNKNVIYTPVHAICESPFLNYEKYSNFSLDRISYKGILNTGEDIMWHAILNTGNYFFYKKNYLECIKIEEIISNSFAADAFYLIYLWMKNIEGAKIQVVDNMKYKHRLHNNSHWINNSDSSNLFTKEIVEKVGLWS
jgi:glycosyltransferase involved in cell wall biosynthesis